MITLTYGRKKPVSPDKGTIVFPALEANVILDDAHNHNGTNSALLTSSASTAVVQSILAASWAAVSGGTYSQLVTMPGVITYDTHAIQFRDATTGEITYLSAEKTSANTYTVYVNDNTKAFTAVYT
jgi:hypothetical protein